MRTMLLMVSEYGTPVYAVADGVIKHRKRMGALGKSVHITHGSNYLTVYAHLSRFSRISKVLLRSWDRVFCH
jgi:murein DD-endopeptidase MepM/ murein hydrolase activator NlpD